MIQYVNHSVFNYPIFIWAWVIFTVSFFLLTLLGLWIFSDSFRDWKSGSFFLMVVLVFLCCIGSGMYLAKVYFALTQDV